jgi:hypothetical protein
MAGHPQLTRLAARAAARHAHRQATVSGRAFPQTSAFSPATGLAIHNPTDELSDNRGGRQRAMTDVDSGQRQFKNQPGTPETRDLY